MTKSGNESKERKPHSGTPAGEREKRTTIVWRREGMREERKEGEKRESTQSFVPVSLVWEMRRGCDQSGFVFVCI